MDDRRIATGVVLLGGVLVGVSCLLDMFAVGYDGEQPASRVTSLWGMRTNVPFYPRIDGVMDAGWPVVAAAVVMVVAALLTLTRGRTAGAARITTVVGAGALLGVVLVFLLDVSFREAVLVDFGSGRASVLTYLPGLYLLVAGTLVGLAGAVLVQRHPVEQAVEQVVGDDVPAEGAETPVEPKGD